MLEFSCADYTFPLLDRHQALALIRLMQFDFVDIGLFERNPNFLTSALMATPRRFIEAVKDDLESAGLQVADVFLQAGADPAQLSVNDPDERVRQTARNTFSKALDFCSAIHSAHLTGLPGVVHGDPRIDFVRAAEEAAWRVEAAANAGVVYAIEPHVGSICSDTARTHALLAKVPGLTLTLDYGHFIFQGESNEAIHTLLPHASHMHVRGAAPGRLQTPASENAIDFPHILRLHPAVYGGRFALEYVWSDWHHCNRTDNVSETMLLRRQLKQMEADLTHGEPQNV